jgi:methylenetetrahydrofolate reductase (NADPH)
MEEFMSLKSKLDAGEFVVLAEMEPPKGVDVSQMIQKATKVKGAVDAFVVPEMSNAVMRMSSLGGAMILQNRGMETIMQANCRDRNRIALQADLLAAQACGIRNVMAVTGEDPSFGDHHEAKAVYDITLLEMLKVIQSLQAGKDMAGIELFGSTDFTTGSTVNAFLDGEKLDEEIEEMEKRIKAGARFFITPPVFEMDVLVPFMEKIAHLDVKIIPTILLLKSVGMARYMSRNVKSVKISDKLITRIRDAGDTVRECITIASELLHGLKKKGVSGVQIATIGWEDRLPEILGGMGV